MIVCLRYNGHNTPTTLTIDEAGSVVKQAPELHLFVQEN